MTITTGSRTPRPATATQCVVDGNGSPGPMTDCTETACPEAAIGGTKRATTGRVAATSRDVAFQPTDDELWCLRTVVSKTGLSRASIYRYAARNLFPLRRRIGPGRVAWMASEVRAWMKSRPLLDRRR